MHVRPFIKAVASPDDVNERAQQAVAAFRHMQHGLTSYARAITGSRKVRVEVSSGPPRTDGNIIYYRPPIALGDKTPHDRALCDSRNESGLKSCPACRIREEVLVNIYHEIAHIAFGSFADGVNYMQVAARYNPYLPYLFNCLEDSRVDSSMFEARKGTRKMLEADTFNLLCEGVPDDSGELHKSADAPMNAQMSLATYLEAAGYQGWDAFMHPAIGRDIRDARVQELLAEVRSATSAKEIYNLALPVLARLRELGYFLSPEEQQERDQQGDPEQNNDPQKGNQQDEEEAGDREPGDGPESRTDAGDSEQGEASQDAGDQTDVGAFGNEVPDQSGEAEDREGASGSSGSPEGASEGDESGEGDSGASGGDMSDDSGSGSDESEAEQAPGDAANGANEIGSEQAESPNGGLSGGADQDKVPGDAGAQSDDPGAGGDAKGADEESDSEGSGSTGSPVEAGDGADREADPSESTVAGGGNQAKGGDLGESLGDSIGTEGPGGEDSDTQLDDSSREGPSGSRPEEGSADCAEEQSDHTESGNEGSDDGLDCEGDRPNEVMESGADEGKGGVEVVEVVEESRPRDGNEDDVKAALEHGHPHLEPGDKIMGTEEEQHAIALAVIQGLYFETPSVGVSSVYEHSYSPEARGWDARGFDADEKVWYGITCDMDVSEKVLGPALLKTRRIFSDNKNSAYQPNLRSGRVNGKVLGKRAWSDDDRLFGKKRIPAKQDYAVLIMMDISSSNLGDNLALLKRSVFAQAELCQRVGIKFAIVAHSASMERFGDKAEFAMHLHHVKEWDEPWTTDTKNRVGDLVGIGGNLDGHAMEHGRKMLGKVEATDKIMLYYTDGKMPAANKDEELEVLQRQIKLAKRDHVTLLGVGIRTNSPVRHGLDTVQVDDDDDLKVVVEHLGKRLARSAR